MENNQAICHDTADSCFTGLENSHTDSMLSQYDECTSSGWRRRINE